MKKTRGVVDSSRGKPVHKDLGSRLQKDGLTTEGRIGSQPIRSEESQSYNRTLPKLI